MVRLNFSAIGGPWYVMDDIEIPIQKSRDESHKMIFFNGWPHDRDVFLLLYYQILLGLAC